jgi:hypothetical protein
LNHERNYGFITLEIGKPVNSKSHLECHIVTYYTVQYPGDILEQTAAPSPSMALTLHDAITQKTAASIFTVI